MGQDPLTAHLRSWVGDWPPTGGGLDVVAHPGLAQPGWDGRLRPLRGVSTPDAGVLGVVADVVGVVDDLLGGASPLAVTRAELATVSAQAFPGLRLGRGVFRASPTAPAVDDLPDAGDWVPRDDPRVPRWLLPFNDDEVLISWDDDGAYGAGVGIKVHDDHGAEVAVVTEERLRGRGLARRLVAQAMRRITGRGQVVTYLHAEDNVASARVADALGLHDEGWRVWGVYPDEQLPMADG